MADQPNSSGEPFDPRLQLLINAVTDYAIYMLDAEGRVATWNPGARRFKGYEASEIIGQHYSRFFPEEDRASGLPERALARAAAEGRYESEGWRVRKDGTRFWAHVVIDPIRADDGSLIGFAKITRDVTDKREAQRALHESEQRFRMLVEGVRDYALCMLDTEGRVANWNSGAQTIKGYRADEIIGEHFSRFYTEEDRAAGVPARTLATAVRDGKYEAEAWRVRKDGTRFFANVVIDPIRAEDGTLIGFAKITRDITDRLRAQQELEEARTALVQAQKLQALGELTGGIAHDFNNLITVIRGSADLLRRDDLPAEKRERYLQAIIDTSDRASELTDHLLAFGRRQALKPEVVDLNLRLDALGEVLSRTLGSQVQVVLDLAPDLWRVEVDPTHLETALLNAAINARDAMADGGTLTFRTANRVRDDREMVEIAIQDSGEGIPPDLLQRVFEPFFTTKPIGKGTGLGLSQIHGFAAQAGGAAEIESKLGEGTTVRLLLPRSDKVAAQDTPTPVDHHIPQGLLVLLVEDNRLVRDFAAGLLTELGCRVISADDALEAQAVLHANSDIDLVFSDIVMPGMSGVELARALHAERQDLPILLASGYSEDVISGVAREFDVIPKPYTAETIGAAIGRALAARNRKDT